MRSPDATEIRIEPKYAGMAAITTIRSAEKRLAQEYMPHLNNSRVVALGYWIGGEFVLSMGESIAYVQEADLRSALQARYGEAVKGIIEDYSGKSEAQVGRYVVERRLFESTPEGVRSYWSMRYLGPEAHQTSAAKLTMRIYRGLSGFGRILGHGREVW